MIQIIHQKDTKDQIPKSRCSRWISPKGITFFISAGLCIATFYAQESCGTNTGDDFKKPYRNVIWAFASSIVSFSKTLPDSSKLEGHAGAFTVGYGRTQTNSWWIGRLHVLSGPWGQIRNGTFDADYSGTMLDVEYGTNFPGTSLWSKSSPILTLAGGYIDISGRNIGGNKKSQQIAPNESLYLEQDFKLGISELTLTPSLGWSWRRKPRPLSNEQKELDTRIEASTIKIGALIPLQSKARVTISQRSPTDSPTTPPQRRTTSGNAKGYAIVTSATIWLGI
jgi:hypothetical protein